MGEPHDISRPILDFCVLIGSALIVCAVGVAAFIIAQIRHINPLWVFFALISIGFVAGAREEYRKQFRSIRFVLRLPLGCNKHSRHCDHIRFLRMVVFDPGSLFGTGSFLHDRLLAVRRPPFSEP